MASSQLCISGECKCPSGFKGRDCENGCERGRYGIGCAYRCNCVQAKSDGCDPVSGRCICKPGYKGKARKLIRSALIRLQATCFYHL